MTRSKMMKAQIFGQLLWAGLLLWPAIAIGSEAADPGHTSQKWFRVDVSKGEDRGEVIAVDGRGRIVVAGTADAAGSADFVVVRFLKDGSIDSSFGEMGKRIDLGGDNFVHALGIDGKGRIVVGGFRAKGGRSDFALVRLLADGSPDPSFGDKGRVILDVGRKDEIHYLALQPDGRIVVAGFTGKPRAFDFSLLRFDSHGNPDPTFGNRGLVLIDETREDRLYGLSLQADGRIVATGSVKKAGEEDCAVLRLSPSGERDRSFGRDGLVIVPFSRGQDVCSAVTVGKGGEIWVVGFAEKRGRDTDFGLARITRDGHPNTNFGNDGILLTDFEGGIDVAHAVSVDRAGRVFVAGEYQKSPATLPFRTGFALVAGSSWNLLFLESDPSKNSSALAMTIAPDRLILLTGVMDGALAVMVIPLP